MPPGWYVSRKVSAPPGAARQRIFPLEIALQVKTSVHLGKSSPVIGSTSESLLHEHQVTLSRRNDVVLVYFQVNARVDSTPPLCKGRAPPLPCRYLVQGGKRHKVETEHLLQRLRDLVATVAEV